MKEARREKGGQVGKVQTYLSCNQIIFITAFKNHHFAANAGHDENISE